MEAAIDWIDRDRERLSAAERDAFASWLLASPAHVEAFLTTHATFARIARTLQRDPRWIRELMGPELSPDVRGMAPPT